MLVNLWAEYEDKHPDASIDDFCRFYIRTKKAKQEKEEFLGGIVPPDLHSTIAKLIGRISKLHTTYAVIALKECGLNSLDEFLYLNSIGNSATPKKTEVIYGNFNELSSGLLILDRLKSKGLIVEEDNPEDRRSKQLKLSKKGRTVLEDCYKKMAVINRLFFEDIPREDIELCIHLLSSLEAGFSSRWLEDKGKSFSALTEKK